MRSLRGFSWKARACGPASQAANHNWPTFPVAVRRRVAEPGLILVDTSIWVDHLRALPSLSVATEDETLYFIELRQLMARGIAYIDVHLLAACALHSARLWTRDRRLDEVARSLGLAYQRDTH